MRKAKCGQKTIAQVRRLLRTMNVAFNYHKSVMGEQHKKLPIVEMLISHTVFIIIIAYMEIKAIICIIMSYSYFKLRGFEDL